MALNVRKYEKVASKPTECEDIAWLSKSRKTTEH